MNFHISQRIDGHLIVSWVAPQDMGHGYMAQSLDLTEHIENTVRRVVRQELTEKKS